MTIQIASLLGIILAAIVLFSIERIPADVVALGILVVLILAGLLPVDMAFAGFGSETVIFILALLILTAALVRTGVVDLVGRRIIRLTGDNPNRLLSSILVIPALLSTVMSNTASTAFFLPIVIGLGRRTKVNPTRLLLPLAFATILSSSVTLIATSTNIVISGLMIQNHLKPMGLFELTPVGLPILIVGLVYMYFVGNRLIPPRDPPPMEPNDFASTLYTTEVVILPGSSLAGKSLEEAALGRDMDLTVARVVREKHRYLAPSAGLELEEGDVLLVEGHRDEILKIKNTAGIDIKADVNLSPPDLETEESRLAEAILLPRSPLLGRTLKGMHFRERYGLQVLAINRHGETILRKISQIPLAIGDVLLIQGHRANIVALEENRTLRILGVLDSRVITGRRAPVAIAAFVISLLLATFGILSLPVALLLGVLVVFLTGTINPEEAYRDVDWRVLILIGSMLGLGAALTYTGTAEYLAKHIASLFMHSNPIWLLAAFFTLTVILTQPMSNQTAAVVVVPVAIQTALQLHLNPRTFAMMIAVAASCSFLTPLEPSCLMVYGPGRYRFVDFLRVGSLLTVAIFIISIVLVPLVWPF